MGRLQEKKVLGRGELRISVEQVWKVECSCGVYDWIQEPSVQERMVMNYTLVDGQHEEGAQSHEPGGGSPESETESRQKRGPWTKL